MIYLGRYYFTIINQIIQSIYPRLKSRECAETIIQTLLNARKHLLRYGESGGVGPGWGGCQTVHAGARPGAGRSLNQKAAGSVCGRRHRPQYRHGGADGSGRGPLQVFTPEVREAPLDIVYRAGKDGVPVEALDFLVFGIGTILMYQKCREVIQAVFGKESI